MRIWGAPIPPPPPTPKTHLEIFCRFVFPRQQSFYLLVRFPLKRKTCNIPQKEAFNIIFAAQFFRMFDAARIFPLDISDQF